MSGFSCRVILAGTVALSLTAANLSYGQDPPAGAGSTQAQSHSAHNGEKPRNNPPGRHGKTIRHTRRLRRGKSTRPAFHR